jgi:hypothetical protein
MKQDCDSNQKHTNHLGDKEATASWTLAEERERGWCGSAHDGEQTQMGHSRRVAFGRVWLGCGL